MGHAQFNRWTSATARPSDAVALPTSPCCTPNALSIYHNDSLQRWFRLNGSALLCYSNNGNSPEASIRPGVPLVLSDCPNGPDRIHSFLGPWGVTASGLGRHRRHTARQKSQPTRVRHHLSTPHITIARGTPINQSALSTRMTSCALPRPPGHCPCQISAQNGCFTRGQTHYWVGSRSVARVRVLAPPALFAGRPSRGGGHRIAPLASSRPPAHRARANVGRTEPPLREKPELHRAAASARPGSTRDATNSDIPISHH